MELSDMQIEFSHEPLNVLDGFGDTWRTLRHLCGNCLPPRVACPIFCTRRCAEGLEGFTGFEISMRF
jgi:hypothetical protein